jgi:hypothetical protein
MIQASWVCVAPVSRAIDGIATLRDATAETTVASESMITGSVARCTPVAGPPSAMVDMSNLLSVGWWCRPRFDRAG